MTDTKTVFLGIRDVLNRTSMSRSSLYKLMTEGQFPRPVQIAERRVAWIEAEVDQWIEERVQFAMKQRSIVMPQGPRI